MTRRNSYRVEMSLFTFAAIVILLVLLPLVVRSGDEFGIVVAALAAIACGAAVVVAWRDSRSEANGGRS